MTKKNAVILMTLISMVAVVLIGVSMIQPEALAECDAYLNLEHIESIFGGYVPDKCR